jgi:hypothetical protein
LVVRTEVLLAPPAGDELHRVGEGRVGDDEEHHREDDEQDDRRDGDVAQRLVALLQRDLAIVHGEQPLDALHVVDLDLVPIVLVAHHVVEHLLRLRGRGRGRVTVRVRVRARVRARLGVRVRLGVRGRGRGRASTVRGSPVRNFLLHPPHLPNSSGRIVYLCAFVWVVPSSSTALNGS